MIRRLLAILGRRTMLTFGLVTFLVGALLATVNITSRYALKVYVDDQLTRIPWDLAVYQNGAVNGDRSLMNYVRKTHGITKVETMAFLRARFPEGGEVEAQIDRKPFTTPWLCLLAASDPNILPPELGFALTRAGADRGRGAVLALIGPEYAMGKAFLALQGAKSPGPVFSEGRLAAAVRRNAHRDEFVRARSVESKNGILLDPVLGQESHMIARAALADALVLAPRGEGDLAAGESVRYLPLA